MSAADEARLHDQLLMQDDIRKLKAEVHELGKQIEEHRSAMSTLAVQRAVVVRRMNRGGMGYGKIAELLGISKGRIQQMLNGLRDA